VSWLEVYTAQYSYNGPHRLDITVKSGNKAFAPTWEMVMKTKKGKMSIEEYTHRYTELMRKSYRENRSEWDKLLACEKVVLVCFCPPGAFCHRVLLAQMLEKLGAKYMGEID